ncbi:sensor histidine kinase [Amycolatopsis regifaucium]|uniref:histidine kinase n=1 Tax=Amycolatopsis regifaucium TaxID=546365 RepID=A0A154MGR8_9PSEU|nr:HAMP domain-containing sensor histidine kinase [Amycolatopsis regifaucium]KZB83632.1 histidine kinase [Amycolatopsis regifaucium]OKA03850.1 two-component sensor histidine kinase [Amycolatopsis regifaucium]SFJ66093.1 Signal transduction histidine kinase [Amycolatopsis regifaucium]
MRRTSLALRITVVCLAIAAVAVVVAGLVAARSIRTAGIDVLRRSLSAQADVVASQLDETGIGNRLGVGKVAEVVRGQGIDVVVRRPNGTLDGGGTVAAIAAAKAGLTRSGSDTVLVDGQQYLVEIRTVGARGAAFALVQSTKTGEAQGRPLVRNIVLALGAGLAVAAIAGLVLSRMLSRPLRRAASVANGMRAGRRDLRVPVEGPSEVADVAKSVNELADALQYSEARQREFLLSVSHELRTPLTAVTGFAEAIGDGVAEGEDARRAGETIHREAVRLERLVSDLLELARLGADEFRLDPAGLDLAALVDECADVWRLRCARQNVALRVERPSGEVPVIADPRRLRQVVDGLAENALRVTPAGAPIVFSLVTAAGRARLAVRDGGPGLAPEDYPVAFDRGVLNKRYRDRRPVGSGIGLALAHGLVTRMGGTLTAGPAPEGGAAFTVAFRLG